MQGKVEKGGQILASTVLVSRIWQPGARVSELVEEGVDHGIDGGQALCRGVFEQARDEVDGIGVSFPENLSDVLASELQSWKTDGKLPC